MDRNERTQVSVRPFSDDLEVVKAYLHEDCAMDYSSWLTALTRRLANQVRNQESPDPLRIKF